MEIIITNSSIQFKNPQLGQPTRAVKEHYYGRRIIALIDGEERMFRFRPNELPFDATEDEMIQAIEQRLQEEK